MKYHVVWEKTDENDGDYYEDEDVEVPDRIAKRGNDEVCDWLSDTHGWLVFSLDKLDSVQTKE